MDEIMNMLYVNGTVKSLRRRNIKKLQWADLPRMRD